MSSPLLIKDAAVLRHTLQVRKRLQLEFLGTVSKLFRDFDVRIEDSLLASLLLASPDELLMAVPTGTVRQSALNSRSTGGNKRVRGARKNKGDVDGPQPGGGKKKKKKVVKGDVGGPQPGGGNLRKKVIGDVGGPQPGGGKARRKKKGNVEGPQPGGNKLRPAKARKGNVTGPQPGGGKRRRTK